ncbi:MAG: hypothetical protein ACRERE_12460 [Candidatus Entotheonellia bacterium]
MREETGLRDRFPRGECLDILIGPRGERIWERPWQRNLIAEGLRRLLAALVKGDPQGAPLAFWAVGTGEEAWDDGTLPSDEARRPRTQLFNETGRKAIPPGQVTFLGGDFTNRLEISIEFTTADLPPGPGNQNWQLREFGLFAGGTASANSGILINHRIHPRIDMQDGFTLQRILRLTF